MSRALSPDYKQIIRRQTIAGRLDSKSNHLEKLLLEGLNSGENRRMTAARKKQIYRRALTQ